MRFRKRAPASLAVAGLAAVTLPWGVSASAGEAPGYSGYTSTATASAVMVEIYEPTIPIPATPEMEVHFAYSKVLGDSGSTRGRASWMWPGDPIGEGLKTIVDQGGLPPELGKAGYPVQVNSNYPSGPASHRDEPAPGSVMRTSASDGQVVAETGFSPDGQTQDPEDGDGDQGLELLQQFGQTITGQQATPTQEEPEPEPTDAPAPPAVPDPLSALVDFGGYVSTSRSVSSGDAVTATARAAVGDVRLLGGLVTMSGLDARSIAFSDGAKGDGSGEASYGTMTIAGKKFRFGPDGFEAAGQNAAIPGLPDDPVQALKKLGITITFPEPTFEVVGDQVTNTVAALEVQLDMGPLTTLLNTSRLNDVIGPIAEQLPEEVGPLKSMLTALGNLAPRFVVTLASSRSSVDTVQGIDPPEGPGPDPDTDDGEQPGTGSSGGGPNGGAAGTADPQPASGGTSEPPATAAVDLVSSTPGLPPLFSIPGLLLVAGIAGATLLGSYVRKLGLMALGAGGACLHGLESGLPDLRKVT